jgi:hypothetical protein
MTMIYRALWFVAALLLTACAITGAVVLMSLVLGWGGQP